VDYCNGRKPEKIARIGQNLSYDGLTSLVRGRRLAGRADWNAAVQEYSGSGFALLAVAAAGGHPLAPLVIGEDGDGDHEDGENTEENLHVTFRIA